MKTNNTVKNGEMIGIDISQKKSANDQKVNKNC